MLAKVCPSDGGSCALGAGAVAGSAVPTVSVTVVVSGVCAVSIATSETLAM